VDTFLKHKLGLGDSLNAAVIHDEIVFFDGVKSLRSVDQLGLDLDWLLGFYEQPTVLNAEIGTLKSSISSTGQLWIAWPKKSAKIQSQLSDNLVREIGLSSGLVDTKVVSLDPTWSALKFVFRLKDRKN
jgi:hypothetical protein